MVDDTFYMQLCLDEAWKYQGLTFPNPAVGALILDRYGRLIAIDAHREAGQAHAELNVIAKALEIFGDTHVSAIENPTDQHLYILQNHHNHFHGCTIYVTLEPCNHTGATPACSLLVKTLGFQKVVIGAMDPNPKASGGAALLEKAGIQLVKGVLEQKSEQLLNPFRKWQTGKPYIFFKLAKTSNGTYSRGTISSLASRTLVHQLRAKIDLLVIGGNTVRVDRPTLDCRLTGEKAPDILIYSKQNNFDPDIPLFHIQGRKVFIENSLEKIKQYKFVMIEGGEGMLKETLDIVDTLLFFTTPHLQKGETVQLDAKLATLHQRQIGPDTLEWFKKI